MKIYVYVFSKKHNSTAQPIGAGTEIEVRLKDGCSIIHPECRLTAGSWPEGANYLKCTIGGMVRYYFVDDVNYESYTDRWISCTLDYMGTWKTNIGASTQFIDRSSDLTIVEPLLTDPMVKAKNRVSKSFSEIPSNIYDLNGGYYVLGVLMDGIVNPLAIRGSVSYIALTFAQLQQFINEILTINSSIFSSYSPIQYIVSCVYIPFTIGAVVNCVNVPVTFGNYNASITYTGSTELLASNGVITKSAGGIVLPDHPDAAVYGDYLNFAPFTSHKIFAGPFGDFMLDPELLATNRSVLFNIITDITDGSSILRVQSGTGYIQMIRGHVGVNTPLAQIISNSLLGVAQIAVGAVGSVASMASGNIAGGLAGVAGSAISAVQNMIPKVTTQGLNGSMAELYTQKIGALSEFLRIEGDPIAYIGRPVNRSILISTLSAGAYVQCSNVKLELPCYFDEQEKVIDYMQTGFFYE